MCSFTIAVGDDYKNKDGQKVEQTEWVRIVAFNRLAEIIEEYCRKGSKVFVTGKMKTRSWEDNGIKRYATEIVAGEMQMLDSRGTGDQPHPQESEARKQPAADPSPYSGNPGGAFDNFPDEEIPF